MEMDKSVNLIHAGIDEWNGRITMRYNRTRPYESMMLFRSEIVQENIANTFGRQRFTDMLDIRL